MDSVRRGVWLVRAIDREITAPGRARDLGVISAACEAIVYLSEEPLPWIPYQELPPSQDGPDDLDLVTVEG